MEFTPFRYWVNTKFEKMFERRNVLTYPIYLESGKYYGCENKIYSNKALSEHMFYR